MQQFCRSRKRQLGMIADQQRSGGTARICKLSGDHRTGAGRQSGGQMLLDFDEDKIRSLRRTDAGNAADFDTTVADESSTNRISNLLQRGCHRSHCIAADQGKKSAPSPEGKNSRGRTLKMRAYARAKEPCR